MRDVHRIAASFIAAQATGSGATGVMCRDENTHLVHGDGTVEDAAIAASASEARRKRDRLQRSAATTTSLLRRQAMAAERGTGGRTGGIGLGGILVIVGVVVMVVWSFLLGLVITLVGVIAFGGFAKGKWY